MAKFVHDDIADAALDALAAATILMVCSGEPASYAEASATKNLASHVLSSGDFRKANGDVSGRKLTLASQNGIAVSATGTATYWALGISASPKLLAYGPLATQQVTGGATMNFPELDVDEITDPA